MDAEQQLDEGKVRELVDSIVSHPSFRETLNNMFNNSASSLQTSRPETSRQSNNSLSQSSTTTLSTSRSSNAPTSNRYATPAEEFSALFRRGSSRGRSTFQRGVSHRPLRGQASSVRRRTASAPPYSSRPRKRNDNFRTKDVVLLPDSKADRVIRAAEKADLMERGLVRSELLVNKTWSDLEVLKYFEDCFKENLSNVDVATEMSGTSVPPR